QQLQQQQQQQRQQQQQQQQVMRCIPACRGSRRKHLDIFFFSNDASDSAQSFYDRRWAPRQQASREGIQNAADICDPAAAVGHPLHACLLSAAATLGPAAALQPYAEGLLLLLLLLQPGAARCMQSRCSPLPQKIKEKKCLTHLLLMNL